MSHEDGELLQALEETMVSRRCIADIARERGLKPQKLYALRYKMKSTDIGLVEPKSDTPTKNGVSCAVVVEQNNVNLTHDMLILELHGIKILVGATVSARRVASLVAALKSEKLG